MEKKKHFSKINIAELPVLQEHFKFYLLNANILEMTQLKKKEDKYRFHRRRQIRMC